MNKFILTYFLFLVLSITSCYSQVQKPSKSSLIGVWQISSSKVGSALQANYRFLSDGTFKYTFNQYDDTRRIRSAGGTYEMKEGKLLLYIKYRMEIIGGELVQGAMGFQKDEIVLDGGKLVKVPQVVKEPIEVTIDSCKSDSTQCRKLQNNTYYKISKDPTAFE